MWVGLREPLLTGTEEKGSREQQNVWCVVATLDANGPQVIKPCTAYAIAHRVQCWPWR